MADVNLLMPAFGIVWAEDGNIAVIDEAQWKAGWSFIGSTPPSVAQFNKVMQIGDQKSNYLYQQLLAVQETIGSIGSVKFFDTYADAVAALPDLSQDEVVEIGQDETRGGARTRYIVKSGALVFMVNLDQLRVDLATEDGSGMVGFVQSDTGGAVPRTSQDKMRDKVSVKDFGAVADASVTSGTDNTAAFQLAIAYCEDTKRALYIPAGRYFFNGGKLTISRRIMMYGDGVDSTVLVFGGSPTKEVVTRIIWRAEYDSGDYTNNSDAPIAWAIRLNANRCVLCDFTVTTNHDPSINYPLPFNSETDYPNSNYDVGILTQRALCVLERVDSTGVWSLAGSLLDGSNVGGIGDGYTARDCTLSGLWGHRSVAAQGQPTGGVNYADLAPLDTRAAAGVSDAVLDNCKIYDTSGSVRLTIGGVPNKLVRRGNSGGALYINGQCNNSAKRMQGHHILNCRIASTNRYVYFVNYVNRLRFENCHSEYRAGSFGNDGVTPVVAANCEILVTPNARRVSFIGGEKSGETDLRSFKNTALNIHIIDEVAYDDPSPPGTVPAASMLAVGALRQRGIFAPTVVGSVSGSAIGTFSGYWSKVGNQVRGQVRCALSSKNGVSGQISIGNLPFVSTNIFGPGVDWAVDLFLGDVVQGDSGAKGLINNNTNTIALHKQRSGASAIAITDTDLVDASLIIARFSYDTEDA